MPDREGSRSEVSTMAGLYPPEASDRFVAYGDHKEKDGTITKKEIETFGDGFRMSFKTHGGHTFKVGIDMPRTAKPGNYMFDYYVSVYPPQPGAGSIVETGISLSAAYGWKLAIAAASRDPKVNNEGRAYNGDPLGKSLDLTIGFKKPAAGSKIGRIEIVLGGQSAAIDWMHPSEIDHIRLVSASGDIRGSSQWESMGMSLKEIDGRAPAKLVGHPEWMHGRELTTANRRVVWEGGTSHGFRCRLPPAPAKPGAA